jgi:hypothetical protein
MATAFLSCRPGAGVGDDWGSQAVVASAAFTGDGTTGSPLAIAADGITNTMIADNAVDFHQIAADAVGTDEIEDGSVEDIDLEASVVARLLPTGTNTQTLHNNGGTWMGVVADHK